MIYDVFVHDDIDVVVLITYDLFVHEIDVVVLMISNVFVHDDIDVVELMIYDVFVLMIYNVFRVQILYIVQMKFCDDFLLWKRCTWLCLFMTVTSMCNYYYDYDYVRNNIVVLIYNIVVGTNS